jgi:hypothetical protein
MHNAGTLLQVHAVVLGTTPSIGIDPYYSTTLTDTTKFFSTKQTITNTGIGQDFTSFTTAGIPANTWLVMRTGDKSGTVNNLSVTFRYSEI